MVSDEALLRELLARVERHATSPSVTTVLPNLTLSRIDAPSSGSADIHEPVTCLILQGSKRVIIGDESLVYDRHSYFVASLDLPSTGEVLQATPDAPYFGIGLALDRKMLADLIASMPAERIGSGAETCPDRSFATAPVTGDVLESWAGLTRLLDYPADAAILGPQRERELLYRLLRGPTGRILCQMAMDGGRLAGIRRAIDWLREHYSRPLPTRELAEVARMSVPSFHRHFRRATSMSPLQYQKALRLQAARRLLAAGAEAGTAGYDVGYESVSQFSREYRRAFGLPPGQDSRRLQGAYPPRADLAQALA